MINERFYTQIIDYLKAINIKVGSIVLLLAIVVMAVIVVECVVFNLSDLKPHVA
jgi:hypothetical protein